MASSPLLVSGMFQSGLKSSPSGNGFGLQTWSLTALLLRMTSQMTGHSFPRESVPTQFDSEFAGIDKEVELGLRLAPSHQAANRAACSLAHLISLHPSVPVRLAGVGLVRTRVHLTIAVSLGALDQVKTGGPRACASVAFLRALVDSMAAFDPCLVAIPDPSSIEAQHAKRLQLADLLPAARSSNDIRAVLRSA